MSSRTEHFLFVLYLCPSCRWNEVYVDRSLNLLCYVFFLNREKKHLRQYSDCCKRRRLTTICPSFTTRSYLNGSFLFKTKNSTFGSFFGIDCYKLHIYFVKYIWGQNKSKKYLLWVVLCFKSSSIRNVLIRQGFS